MQVQVLFPARVRPPRNWRPFLYAFGGRRGAHERGSGRCLREFRASASEAFLQRENTAVEGAGISATGQIDDEHGVVIGTNGKIPHYEGARLKADT